MPGLAFAQPHHDAAGKGAAAPRKVAIDFAAVAGGKPVSCARPITGLGTTSRTARLTDLRFYVADVQLLRKGGGAVDVTLPTDSEWGYAKGDAAVTLIDLENGTGSCAVEGTKGMNAVVRGTVPKGRYVGVRYSVSVPDSLNHTDLTTTPAPLNNAAMAWSWQAGRKFMKVEVSEDGGPAWGSKTYFVHVGSTGCKGNPAAGEKAGCSLPNRDEVTLRTFDPARQKIVLDLRVLLAGVDVAGNAGSMEGMASMEGMSAMGGCMSSTASPDCGPIFRALGMRLGTRETTTQTAFRVVGR
ncbi:MAG: metallo-mystery pair system four-Cys motif protein [Actinobacteria bacterium]|nr:metallo-mystery pair system four-Cys motif protein [Actinomycetota bacterium]